MLIAFTVALFYRSTFEVDVVRERGELSHTNSAGQIVNQYSLRVLNKTQQPQSYQLSVSSDLPIVIGREQQLIAALETLPGERVDLPLTLLSARESVALLSTPATLNLCELGSGRCVSAQTSFFGPTR